MTLSNVRKAAKVMHGGKQGGSCAAARGEGRSKQEAEALACLLHAHHETIVHCCAVLLGTLAQVVVQYLRNAQVCPDAAGDGGIGGCNYVFPW